MCIHMCKLQTAILVRNQKKKKPFCFEISGSGSSPWDFKGSGPGTSSFCKVRSRSPTASRAHSPERKRRKNKGQGGAYVHGFATGEPEHNVQDEGRHKVEEDLAQPVHHAVGAEWEPGVPLQVLGRRGQRVILAKVSQLFPAQRVQCARRAVVHPDGVLPETYELQVG